MRTTLLALAVPLGLAAVLGTAFAANEWTHGDVAGAMGLGHRHMLDYGGYHCVDHADVQHADHHRAHLHGNVTMADAQGAAMFGTATMPHGSCPGGAAMHDGTMTGGMSMAGGMRNG